MSAIAQEGISAVPQDVIDSIIDEVANLRSDESDKQDLWNCSLVSPAFRNRSQSWLLRTLKIEIYPFSPSRESTNSWIHSTLETNPRIAAYVRSLSVSIFVSFEVEELQPVGTAGFSGSPLTLPNLHELEILAHAYYNIQFPHLSVEFETELINLIQSPQLRSILFSGILPPMHVAALYKLNRLEMRDTYYDGDFAIHPSLRDLRRSPSQNDETLQSLLCLCNDWEPEKILFSEAFGPLELSMKYLKGYAVFLTGPEKFGLVQMALSSTSETLRSFSIIVGEPLLNPFTNFEHFLSHQAFDLKTLLNLAELEFIVEGNIVNVDAWFFIENTLATIPPFNELTTLKLIFCGRRFRFNDDTDKLAQLDDLLSNVPRFNMLQQVFVSPLGDPALHLPKISSRGIAVNGVHVSV